MTGERAIYFTGFAVCVATYQLWPYLPKGSFYIGMAVSWLVVAFHDLSRTSDKISFDKYSLLVMIAAMGNALDELFFDPKVFGVNDAVISAIVIIGLIHPSKRITWQKHIKTK